MSSANWTSREAGLTLVELMISVVIGLLITLAISTLFINTNRSNTENSNIASMQENARFAMGQIAEDIRHAGFIGDVQNPAEIDKTTLAPAMPAGTDCRSTATGNPFMLDFNSSDKLIFFDRGITDAQLIADIGPCTTVNANADLPAAENTVLLVKRTSTDGVPVATAAPVDGHFYVYSSDSHAVLAQYTTGMAAPISATNTLVWEYLPRYYYITNKDELYRDYFDGVWHSEVLAEGIERFDVEFGVDTDDDGAPNYYDDNPATIVFSKVISARIYVLARTTQVEPGVNDTNNYQFGSVAYVPPAGKLGYHRQVYSTTVTIPNLRNRILLK
jgi:type IV pilus assembly protein PilW